MVKVLNLFRNYMIITSTTFWWLCSLCKLEVPIVCSILCPHVWHLGASNFRTLICKRIKYVFGYLWHHFFLCLHSGHSYKWDGRTNSWSLWSKLTGLEIWPQWEVAIHILSQICIVWSTHATYTCNVSIIRFEVIDWLTRVTTSTLRLCPCVPVSWSNQLRFCLWLSWWAL